MARPRQCAGVAVTWRETTRGNAVPLCALHRDAFDARARKWSRRESNPDSPSAPTLLGARAADSAPAKSMAAIYLRVSTDEQTVDNQRPDVDRVLAIRELELVELYAESVSAAKARPEFDRMLADAARGRFKVLAIWSLDRFGRSMVGNMNAVRELDRLGVSVVSVREPWLDTTGPVRQLLIAIFSWVAEQERVRLGERTRAGMDRARRTGKAIGRPRARIDPNELDMLIGAANRRLAGKFRARDGAITLSAMARRLKVSESTLRRELMRRVAERSSTEKEPF